MTDFNKRVYGLVIIKDVFSKCIDVKMFGITFAMKSGNSNNKNLSLTGPLQISYGVNKYKENILCFSIY